MNTKPDILSALKLTVEGQFLPTNPQKRAKSAFWTHFSTAGEGSLTPTPSLATALRFGQDNRIQAWWDQAGFQDWFWNRDEFRQRMEYLANLAVDELEEILLSKQVATSDKLNAIKMVMQVSQKTTPVRAEESLPDLIGKMNRVQLEEYIRSGLKLLPIEQLTIPPAPDKVD